MSSLNKRQRVDEEPATSKLEVASSAILKIDPSKLQSEAMTITDDKFNQLESHLKELNRHIDVAKSNRIKIKEEDVRIKERNELIEAKKCFDCKIIQEEGGLNTCKCFKDINERVRFGFQLCDDCLEKDDQAHIDGGLKSCHECGECFCDNCDSLTCFKCKKIMCVNCDGDDNDNDDEPMLYCDSECQTFCGDCRYKDEMTKCVGCPIFFCTNCYGNTTCEECNGEACCDCITNERPCGDKVDICVNCVEDYECYACDTCERYK